MSMTLQKNGAKADLHNRSPQKSKYQDVVETLFALADTRINGNRPFDLRVVNDKFYERVIRDGGLGMGESYVDGWWECDSIDEMTARFIRANLHKESYKNPRVVAAFLKVKLSGIGKKSKAFEVGQKHYDLGNDLFKTMLDKRMSYSCGYWKDAVTLDQAQENKLDLICRKLDLKPGMRVLEIGCGW